VLTVRFFARLRETLGCEALQLPLEDATQTVGDVRRLLSERGDTWASALGEDNLITAVNQVVVTDDPTLADGDEIAFFPPVTGG
jgi:molybdopterin synthase sulfur carrier subunit